MEVMNDHSNIYIGYFSLSKKEQKLQDKKFSVLHNLIEKLLKMLKKDQKTKLIDLIVIHEKRL